MKRGKIICDYSHNGKRNPGFTAIPHQSVSRMNTGSDNLAGDVCARIVLCKHTHLWFSITFILMSEQKDTFAIFVTCKLNVCRYNRFGASTMTLAAVGCKMEKGIQRKTVQLHVFNGKIAGKTVMMPLTEIHQHSSLNFKGLND